VTGVRYAEVIGDPIAQSKSPIIHKYWLERLKLAADYRPAFVPKGSLAGHLSARRDDPDWLGCNVTIPHKEAAVALVDRLDAKAAAIGAVNCVVRVPDGLAGSNTDVDGIAAALDPTALEGAKSAIIGAGGGARAAVAYLASRNVGKIAILVRDPVKAATLREIAPGTSLEICHFGDADAVLDGAEAIVNASPLGMASCPPMPDDLLAAIAHHAPQTTVFDMVYDPIETRFLATGREAGAHGVDGLTMLIGQAARAFELFFGEGPPPGNAELRGLLVTAMPVSV
jgi:shikimate dehydrogenase